MELNNYQQMIDFLDFLDSSSSSEENNEESEEEFANLLDQCSSLPKIPKTRKEYIREDDLFSKYDDDDFERRFRLTKAMVENLVQEIEPNLKILSYRNNPISVKLQLLITLRYYATGSFQIVTSDLFGVSQSSISRIICRITHQIGNLAKQEIKFPATVNELSKLKVEFYIVGGIPHIIGIIDGTHIPIQSVGGNNAESYRNRKSYFSINTQIICDVNMRILDINARWPGSCHDQMMFNFSKIRARFESGEFGESLLLGDSGYACRNYLLTPVLNPTTQKEISYNKGFIKTRLIVEQTIGVWKRRFPVLSTKMRLKTETTVAVIVATAVLHNRLKDRAVPEPDMTEFFVDGMNLETGNLRSMTSPSDFDKRNEIINNFF